MAKLINVYRADDTARSKIERRQLPLSTGENMMMLMDLNSKGLVIDCPMIKGKELDEFMRKYNILSYPELKNSLQVREKDILFVLRQNVQCVGCRRSVENLFLQLSESKYPTLDPLVISDGVLTLIEDKTKTPQLLGTVLYKHKEILDNVMENKIKNRNTTRCILHSRDALRSKLFSESWREIWTAMKQRCREELTVIETQELYDVLDEYLKKHKFCQECKTKVEKAYNILVSDSSSKEKGYVAALYSNIKKCLADNHIHIETRFDFIDMLIQKAETEINGSYLKQRERHAKTLEVAQKEILTCIGMIVYERLKKIYVSLREEERACQVLAAVGVHALSRSFNSAVESKQGISNLELCYQEISRAEKAKELKREQRKLKKKRKKIEKKNKLGICTAVVTAATSDGEADHDDDAEGDPDRDGDDHDHDDEDDDDVQENEAKCDANVKEKSKYIAKKLTDKNHNKPLKEKNNNCPCEKVGEEIYTKSIDGGYSSDPSQLNSRTSSVGSSLEGSEVSCSDDFCNHNHRNKSDKISGSDLGTCNGVNRQYIFSNNNNNKNCNNIKISNGKSNINVHINNSLCSVSNPLSLEQMLDSFNDLEEEDDEEKKCYIPDEVLMEFKCREGKVKQERAELREYLRKSFAEMCVKTRGICKLTD
ncbi:gametogenetin-binding protein 2-like [Condylostylus longicornis]|uniref:gametogenetin-binding protein 2-like n=1 Tax=Condylostylus longicornis TaxID=2530218 RepID=UPI00244E2DCE|nr:gametogenetin-binding protein 2-like [Condylostylus longicornis]